MEYVSAFIVGGLIGLLAQIIFYVLTTEFNIKDKDATSMMMVFFIFISC